MSKKKGDIEVKEWKEIKDEYSGKNATIVLGANAYKVIDDEGYDCYHESVLNKLKNGRLGPLFEAFKNDSIGSGLETLGVLAKISQKVFEGCNHEKIKEILDEFFKIVHPLKYSDIKEKLIPYAKGVNDENDIQRLYSFFSSFKYVFSLDYSFTLYWMFVMVSEYLKTKDSKDEKPYWTDLFCSEKEGPSSEFLIKFKKKSANFLLSSKKENILLYPYGSLILMKHQEDGQVSKVKKGEDDSKKLAEVINSEMVGGFCLTAFREGSSSEDESFFRENEYLQFIYNEVIPKIEKEHGNTAVLYGVHRIRDREYLLKHLFQYVDKVAVSSGGDRSPEVIQDALKAIEQDCRDKSKKPIQFTFFKRESVLGE